jgi:hypothetical protein
MNLGPLSVACPRCEARVGKKCTNGTKLRLNTLPHPERVAAAKQ